MANLFEQPIAATPISEFAALPLEYMERSLRAKEARHNANKVAIDNLRTSFGEIKAGPGDVAARDAEIDELEGMIESYASSAEGDYSNANFVVDQISNAYKKKMRGKLGHIHSAGTRMEKDQATLNDMALKGTLNEGARQMYTLGANTYQTTELDGGGFSTYQGYNQSGVRDPRAELLKVGQAVREEHLAEGGSRITFDRLKGSLQSAVMADTRLLKSMQEKYLSRTGKLPQGEGFQKFLDHTVNSIASDLQSRKYPPISTSKNKSKKKDEDDKEEFEIEYGPQFSRTSKAPKITLNTSLADKFGNPHNLNKWKKTAEGKEVIAGLERERKEKAPTDPGELIDWITTDVSRTYTEPLTFIPMAGDKEFSSKHMTADGLPTGPGAIYDRDNNIIDSNNHRNLFGKDKDGVKGSVLGISTGGGVPKGRLILQDRDGKWYSQERKTASSVADPERVSTEINTSIDNDYGYGYVELETDAVYDDASGIQRVYLPQGSYKTVKSTTEPGVINIYDTKMPPNLLAKKYPNGAIKPVNKK